MKIFVGNLPWSIEEAELSQYFEKFGAVSSASIITDRISGRSRGFGFVEMSDDEAARKAIEALNGTEIAGRAAVVNQAQEKTERPRRDFNRGGGGYGNKGGGNRW